MNYPKLLTASLLLLPLATGTAAAQQAPATGAGSVIEGLVLDTLGDPVPAVEVRAERDGALVARSSGDGDGHFRLRLPDSGAELMVRAAGKAAVRVPWHGATRAPVERIELEDAASLRGRVLDADGQPLPGARVLAAAPGFRGDTTTDGRGDYHFPAVPLRPLNLFAVGPRGRCETRVHVTGDRVLDLQLNGRGDRAFVRVLNLPADRLANARLRLFGTDVAAAIDGGRLALRPDATAEVTLRDACLVTLEAVGYATKPNVQWLHARSNADLDCIPRALPFVSGRLRSLSGKPAVGIQVVLRDRSNRELATAITGADGSFRGAARLPLEQLAAAGARLGIRLGEGILIADSQRTFADGHCWATCDPSLPMPVQVEGAATVRQRLVDDRGEVLAFAEITVTDDTSDTPHRPLLSTWTTNDGQLTLDLPASSLRLLAVSPSGVVMTAQWQADGALGAPVWKPVRCGHVEGVLRNAAGAPVPGIEILVASVDLQAGGNDAAKRQRVVVRTDRLGRFRCRGLPIGDWTLATLAVDEPANAMFAARTGETTKVDLQFAR
jgi:hypothetical protein